MESMSTNTVNAEKIIETSNFLSLSLKRKEFCVSIVSVQHSLGNMGTIEITKDRKEEDRPAPVTGHCEGLPAFRPSSVKHPIHYVGKIRNWLSGPMCC